MLHDFATAESIVPPRYTLRMMHFSKSRQSYAIMTSFRRRQLMDYKDYRGRWGRLLWVGRKETLKNIGNRMESHLMHS